MMHAFDASHISVCIFSLLTKNLAKSWKSAQVVTRTRAIDIANQRTTNWTTRAISSLASLTFFHVVESVTSAQIFKFFRVKNKQTKTNIPYAMEKNTCKCLSRTSNQVTTFMLSQASEPNYERSLNSPKLISTLR